jgi:hypothetical protein
MNEKKPLSESQEQINFMQWAKTCGMPGMKLIFAIPNGGTRNTKEAYRMKREGVKSGVPDLLLPVPRFPYHGLFIEMKRTKNFKVSDEQKQWCSDLHAQGYRVEVCLGAQEAIRCAEDYYRSPKWPVLTDIDKLKQKLGIV